MSRLERDLFSAEGCRCLHLRTCCHRCNITDDGAGKQLEEIWQYNEALLADYQNGETPAMKWKMITATVTHDPENFGKAYLVSHIEFTE